MKRGAITLSCAVMVLLAVPATVSAQMPDRPAPLTVAQFETLCQLETQSQHAEVLALHATYKSEREQEQDRTRLANDVSTGVFQFGLPVALLAILIAAAPL